MDRRWPAPGEIRNEIYGLVHAESRRAGSQDRQRRCSRDGLRGKLALATTYRQETDGFPAGLERALSFSKPNWSITQYGNKTLRPSSIYDAWLHSIKAHTSINPKRIMLRRRAGGRKLADMEAWKDELERIINRIPLEGLMRKNFVFAIDVVVSAHQLPHTTTSSPYRMKRLTMLCNHFEGDVCGWRPRSASYRLMVKEWEDGSEGAHHAVRSCGARCIWRSLAESQYGEAVRLALPR